MVQPPSEQEVVQRRTTLVSIAAASVLVILKLGVGLIAGSLALISAGIESSGDVVAATLTFFAVRLGRQPADPGHPYGHALVRVPGDRNRVDRGPDPHRCLVAHRPALRQPRAALERVSLRR